MEVENAHPSIGIETGYGSFSRPHNHLSFRQTYQDIISKPRRCSCLPHFLVSLKTHKKLCHSKFSKSTKQQHVKSSLPPFSPSTPGEGINIWKRVKISLGGTTNHPNHQKILYQIKDAILQFIKRWEDESMCNEHKGQKQVQEVIQTPLLNTCSLVGIGS